MTNYCRETELEVTKLRFEAGKYYICETAKPDQREEMKRKCLYVSPQGGVVLEGSQKFTEELHFKSSDFVLKYWEEYKFPVVLKYYIPVVRWSKTGKAAFAYHSISAVNRETVERRVAQINEYELIDIVEVTWKEGEATKLQEHGKVR